MAEGNEPATPPLAAADRAGRLLRLLAWLSPAFPVGAYSCSHGLEWAVEAGAVRDAASLQAWIEDVLRHGAGWSDAILFAHVFRAVRERDWPRAAGVAELALALQPARERALEATAQGRAFVRAVEAAWPCGGAFERVAEPTYAVAVAVAAAAHGLALGEALASCLHAFAANLVSAGIRLIPLGQTEGLKVIAALEALILNLAAEAGTTGLDAIGGACLLSDIAAMRHETQYTRLFRT